MLGFPVDREVAGPATSVHDPFLGGRVLSRLLALGPRFPRGYMFRHETLRLTACNAVGFATIGMCRNVTAQAALSGGSSRESLRSLSLRITGSTATMEPGS